MPGICFLLWSVDIKIWQRHRRKAVDSVEDSVTILSSRLGYGLGLLGVWHHLFILTESGGVPVDRRGRGIHNLLYSAVPGGHERIQSSVDICFIGC